MSIQLHIFHVTPTRVHTEIAARSYEVGLVRWHPWYAIIRDLMLHG
jgi:hypothetical protein